jgi:hypothetical protein
MVSWSDTVARERIGSDMLELFRSAIRTETCALSLVNSKGPKVWLTMCIPICNKAWLTCYQRDEGPSSRSRGTETSRRHQCGIGSRSIDMDERVGANVLLDPFGIKVF